MNKTPVSPEAKACAEVRMDKIAAEAAEKILDLLNDPVAAEAMDSKDEELQTVASIVSAALSQSLAEREQRIEKCLEMIEYLADEVEHAYMHGGYAGGEGTDQLVKDARALIKGK